MPKVKPILYTSKTLADGTHPIVLRVSDKKERKYFKLDFSCLKNEWDSERSEFIKKFPKYKIRNKFIKQKLYDAEDIIEKMRLNHKVFSFEAFKKEFVGIEPQNVIGYFDEVIDRMYKTKNNGNADIYKNVRNSISNYSKKKKINFHQVNVRYLNKYVEHLKVRGLQNNSINLYLRTLRALYNKAIAEGVCSQEHYPFKEFKFNKIKNDPSRKALTKQQIKKIFDYVPDPNSKQERSKNIFLFSYLTRGMNFNDIAKLKWSNIKNGKIHYVRSKNGKKFVIGILSPVQEILDHYEVFNPNSEYIFPILSKQHKTIEQIRERIKSVLKRVNKHLKTIGEAVGIETKLTTYIARHSYAMVLKNEGKSIALISDALGHDNEDTTNHYLEVFGSDILDGMDEALL